LGPLESVTVLGLGVVFREAYVIGIFQIWYRSIDIHFILLHVKFEYGLFISVMQNRAIRHKNLQLEIEKFLKKSSRRPLFFHTPPFSNSCEQGLVIRASKVTGTYSKD
jgi:hypothetical protein